MRRALLGALLVLSLSLAGCLAPSSAGWGDGGVNVVGDGMNVTVVSDLNTAQVSIPDVKLAGCDEPLQLSHMLSFDAPETAQTHAVPEPPRALGAGDEDREAVEGRLQQIGFLPHDNRENDKRSWDSYAHFFI